MSLRPCRLIILILLALSFPFLLCAKLPPKIQEDHIVRVLAYDPQVKLVLVKAGVYNVPEFKFRKALIPDKAKRKRLNHALNRLAFATVDETPGVIQDLKRQGTFDELLAYLYKTRDSFVWGRESDEYMHMPYTLFLYCGDQGLHLFDKGISALASKCDVDGLDPFYLLTDYIQACEPFMAPTLHKLVQCGMRKNVDLPSGTTVAVLAAIGFAKIGKKKEAVSILDRVQKTHSQEKPDFQKALLKQLRAARDLIAKMPVKNGDLVSDLEQVAYDGYVMKEGPEQKMD